ncbi:Cytochrome c biogenesis protein CcsA [compost metagenome]|uniref:C-type cytochrome biogenesis protein CcsB n=1 Tax=Janthinobacterium lividum TaxID=29581 RepID=A0A5C4NIB5_9BURK|nr:MULTISPECIES: c-type cytochrome biogenesis protein CcsB [Janthinobacterium]MBW3502144.1 c-type cytochrome biogenesis protein CcsB [Janthinobacterium sp. NKUCC08_JDC]MCC7643011.1 c-type cytochrome biogenesis protein CcsB [Janthinobacterium sp. EB271-G4-3-1]MCC7693087.1 c-type cytochrome biogenesis protein CcsB [Janthinobacterium sp. EB271-G4-3-2]OEZ77771.1 cytochrome c biogenesis protein CcsA [Janthinobacterium sp. HH104]TNC73670.1 c-type cytochrome biogenesis protein CcsB [Janthinobacterium
MELANKQIYTQEPGFFKRLSLIDWLYGAGLLAASLFGLMRFGEFMDIYEKAILLAAAPTFAWLGWYWKPVRWLIPVAAVLSLFAIELYAGHLEMANQKFFLKYILSSQSAILWMGTLFVLSTLFYWIGLVARSEFGSSVGSLLCWAGVVLGLTGMLVRWYESYLIGADVGHIPVSNLYEVFILFSLITAMFYLYYEQHYATRQLGAFVMLVISAAVVFLMWYTVTRDAAEIQPLVPALQSWWMKIHVPANFIGYGTFALSAMVAAAYLLKSSGYLVDRLPSLEVLDDVMYKAISVGFAFFTVATILGALWAAEAWGGYWSWDPKETWALIVWLNYAAWLHMRLMTGLRGRVASWWALVGLLVTTFAFLGVNMFLSGLHSYGKL